MLSLLKLNHNQQKTENILTNMLDIKQRALIMHRIKEVINQPHIGLMVDSSQLTFLLCSKSHDTKTRVNIKNPARSI